MHQSVLLQETLHGLNLKKGGRYVDGTLGLGGHAEGILREIGRDGTLLGLDVDPNNLVLAEDRLQPFEDQTITRQVNFRGLQGVLQDLKWTEVDGMIFDLGVSSTQLDKAERGFSFQSDAPLDMRMNPNNPETALSCLNRMNEDELADLFKFYGEHRGAKRIARYLKNDVSLGKIQTTRDLAGFCERVIGWRGKVHPATKIFLAIRSQVNQELEALKELLDVAPSYLCVGGRLAIISFHSLEDKEVKQSFRKLSTKGSGRNHFKLVVKKPIVPSEEEIKENPRSRSAKLRLLERVE